jgi:glycosyltransferase involved in cell wall biosynthesis
MTQHTAHKVSVVTANYNNAGFLEDYFQGILNSELLPYELIIADDGSADASPEIIKSYALRYPWIKPVFLAHNAGVANATNKALESASGEFILRIDSDDFILPHRIKEQLDFMIRHPEVDVLGGNCWYFDGDSGKRIFQSRFPTTHQAIEKLIRSAENGVLNGTTMVRRKWFERFNYRQEMVWAEDYDLFARLLHAGARFAAHEQPNTMVRIHRNSATSNLQPDTLMKAYNLSVELFNNKMNQRAVIRNYKHLIHYRNYLLKRNFAARIIHLVLASFYRPDKLFKRFLRS